MPKEGSRDNASTKGSTGVTYRKWGAQSRTTAPKQDLFKTEGKHARMKSPQPATGYRPLTNDRRRLILGPGRGSFAYDG
jgi:hypothetical protein